MACWPGNDGPRVAALALLAALALCGCRDGSGRLAIVGIESRIFATPELVLRVALPAALNDGMQRGIALSFRLDLDGDDGARSTHRRELRYLQLTRQYQLREPDTGFSRSYGSRAAALAALERWPLPALPGGTTIRARVRLDSTRLPAPLVLPALFDADWRLDSGTTQWPSDPR